VCVCARVCVCVCMHNRRNGSGTDDSNDSFPFGHAGGHDRNVAFECES